MNSDLLRTLFHICQVLLLTGRDAAPPGNCSLVQVQGIKHDKGQSPSQHYFWWITSLIRRLCVKYPYPCPVPTLNQNKWLHWSFKFCRDPVMYTRTHKRAINCAISKRYKPAWQAVCFSPWVNQYRLRPRQLYLEAPYFLSGSSCILYQSTNRAITMTFKESILNVLDRRCSRGGLMFNREAGP